jgi:integrase
MKLTVRAAEGLKLPRDKNDHIEFDDDIPGFGIRLREDSKSWVFQYAAVTDKKHTRRITFGRYPAMGVPAARKEAERYHALVKQGRDPAGEKAESKARAGETFEACLRLYLARRRHDPKLRASSYGEIERHLTRNLQKLHPLRIDQVDRRAIALELSRLTTESGPIQANRTRASVMKFLDWCAREGFIESNPAEFTNKNPEQARGRVLSMSELKTVWLALPEGDYGDIVRLLMLLGQRAREVGDLRHDEIAPDYSTITLPPARTKNRCTHVIHLPPAAAAILKSRARDNGRELVFGTGQRGFSGWSKSKERLDARVKLAPWVIHDLRRATSTHMGEIGILPHVVEGCLNHVSGTKGGIAGRYNKAQYEGWKAEAWARWADHLMAAIEGRNTNISPLKRSAGPR